MREHTGEGEYVDEFTLTLNSPITEEQWDDITDVDFDHTDRIFFHTKHGKEVEFAKVVRCKDCEHFHWDMPYVIQGVPVLGHEVCDFWGGGCKTAEDGFCSYAEKGIER